MKYTYLITDRYTYLQSYQGFKRSMTRHAYYAPCSCVARQSCEQNQVSRHELF